MGIKEEIKILNKKYEENQYNGTKLNNQKNNYLCINGDIPILLSAPHAVKHLRNGTIKEEDANTGGITEYLCNKCKCYGIIRNYNNSDDPNKDINGPGFKYKQEIINIVKKENIKILLDMHACSNSHNFDVCIGTNDGINLNGYDNILDIIYGEINKIAKVAIDEEFKASLDGNVSKYISENTKIPCIQIEISKMYRNEKLEEMIKCLEKVIDKISNFKY